MVELFLFAVIPQVLQKSAVRYFDLQAERSTCKHFERSTSHVLGRHYRVLPQRTSRRFPERPKRCGVFAGQSRRRLQSIHYVTGCGARSRGSEFHVFDVGRGKPRRTAKPECSKRCWYACGGPRPKPGFVTQHRHRSGGARERHRSELHLYLRRSEGTGASSKRRSGRSRINATKLPFWSLFAEAQRSREGSTGFRGSSSVHRGGKASDRPPEGCLPSTSHRGGAQTQDTQRECDDISHGVQFLSASKPRRSLCRLTSPTPSALGVSHSLSGLSPPGPRGFVSRHIRP